MSTRLARVKKIAPVSQSFCVTSPADWEAIEEVFICYRHPVDGHLFFIEVDCDELLAHLDSPGNLFSKVATKWLRNEIAKPTILPSGKPLGWLQYFLI